MKVILKERLSNKLKIGSIPKISKEIGINPNTLRRHLKSNDDLYLKGDYEVYLDVQEI